MEGSFLQKANIFLSRVKLTDKLFFAKNLRLMIQSGISLSDALDSLKAQTTNLHLKKILTDLGTEIRKGKSFSSQLEKYPRVFPDIFVNMVRAGEQSGQLEEVLDTLAIQMRKAHDLTSRVKGALAYPLVILVAMVGITTGLLVFIVPKLLVMFADTGMELPLPTKILVVVSNGLTNYFYIIIIVGLMLVMGFLKIRKTTRGKQVLHKLTLKAPVLGTLANKINLARTSRSLSSLLKTDIPVVEALEITSRVVENIYFQGAFKKVAEKVKTGSSIHVSLKEFDRLFPATFVQMVSVGEETGKLDEILGEVALFYEDELDSTLRNLPSLLEPLLILILGGTVGGIALAIMMPIFSLSQVEV